MRTMRGITARVIRSYYNSIGQKRNKGGVHVAFRCIRAFLRRWEMDAEPEEWSNPIYKVPIDHPSKNPLPDIPIDQVYAMTDTCDSTFAGRRDKALLLFLFARRDFTGNSLLCFL